MTRKNRRIRWQIFLSDWRSSQKIWWTQNCMHPHTVLRTQIRNILRKCNKIKEAPYLYPIYTHFPKDQNCEVCLRTKMTRAPCRRRTGEALLRGDKFGDLITAEQKSSQWGMWIKGQSPVRCRDYKILPTQWIQSYPCKTKTSHETERSLSKFLEPSHKPKAVYRQLNGIWECMWRSIMESPLFNTSSIRDKWHRWKSRSTNKRRYFSSVATIRIGWKVVVTSWRTRKRHMNDDLENHSKGQ